MVGRQMASTSMTAQVVDVIEKSGNTGRKGNSAQETKGKTNSFLVAGIGFIVAGLVWLGVGLAYNWIFYYPFFLIFAGIVIVVRSWIQKPDGSNQVVDSELFDEDDTEVV